MRAGTALLLLAVALQACGDAAAQTGDGTVPSLTLDHVPVAVSDLRAAERRYRDGLCFSIKPGRLHANGIDNVHVKFADGSALELITASEPRDGLAAFYAGFTEEGDGGAFVSLGGPAERIAGVLHDAGIAAALVRGSYARSVVPDPEGSLAHVFFLEYTRPPVDRPEHVRHANTALGLHAVWLAAADFGPEEALLDAFGLGGDGEAVRLPVVDAEGRSVGLGRGHVYLLPPPSGMRPGRRIAGVTVAVEDLDRAAACVEALRGRGADVYEHARGRSVLVEPDLAHGIWLEFLERAGE